MNDAVRGQGRRTYLHIPLFPLSRLHLRLRGACPCWGWGRARGRGRAWASVLRVLVVLVLQLMLVLVLVLGPTGRRSFGPGLRGCSQREGGRAVVAVSDVCEVVQIAWQKGRSCASKVLLVL